MTVIERCRALALFSEDATQTTRTFLSPPMHDVHSTLRQWMESLSMRVWVDAAGNLRGAYPGLDPEAPRLLIGSHLDTVPCAGAYDGVLGVVLAIALVESLRGRRLLFGIDIVGFSEEEGVRYGVPFIGSRALIGTLDVELTATIAPALRDFGLNPEYLPAAVIDSQEYRGYLEFHIEQGPVLESLNLGLGIVTAIAGQSRFHVTFKGQANHAGTTPMHLRRDALTAAARWICDVERHARAIPGLVGTVGRIEAFPGASNVIAGEVRASLDVRHSGDAIRRESAASMLAATEWTQQLDQNATTCDPELVNVLERAVESAGYPAHRMVSGAGHDAMVMAQRLPVAMLFLRSPGGISHHPNETVLPQDVDAALRVGLAFLNELEARHG